MKKYGDLILGPDEKLKKQGPCTFEKFGKGGGHALCGPSPTLANGRCTFLSFGINDDPSFDVDLAERWKCRGFAGDPTVTHPSKLHPSVTFHNLAAKMVSDNEEREVNKGGEEDWWVTSMPALKKFLGLDTVEIIKMDCEGCEVSLARDVIAEDRGFFFNVDQISIETHVTKIWIRNSEHFYYFALLFALLEEAGFVMEWSSIFGCNKKHEIVGCTEELVASGFPCGYTDWVGHPNVVHGRSCQDFLFKRYD